MEINFNKLNNFNYQKNKSQNLPKKNSTVQQQIEKYLLPNTYPAVYFCGNISSTINNPEGFLLQDLIKSLDEILKNNITEELSPEEKNIKIVESKIRFVKKRIKKLLEYKKNVQEFNKINNRLNNQQKKEYIIKLQKEKKALLNMQYQEPKFEKNKVQDTTTDFVLINKFKNSVLNKDYNLSRVYKEHYSGLNDIKNLKELSKKYPKIQIPNRPEEVIAKKIEKSLNRGFFLSVEDLIQKYGYEESQEYVYKNLKPILDNLFSDKSPKSKEKIYEKISQPTLDAIYEKVDELYETDSFKSVPENRKQKNILSKEDKMLIERDYDDFVLTVLREQYLNNKKTNQIVYTDKNGYKVNVSEIKDKNYSFPKIPNNINKIINNAENIKNIIRDYDKYDKEKFQQRLGYYSDVFGENEELLEKMVDFSDCQYLPEDIAMLKLFLKEIDKVFDKEKTLDEALYFINKNSIVPKGTIKQSEAERQAHIEKQKIEAKQLAKLRNIQDNFDQKINILYQNSLPVIAEICSVYRPENLEENSIQKANDIINIINSNILSQKDKKLDREKTEKEIIRFDKYVEYSEKEPDLEKLEKAKQYSINKKGKEDINTIGKYLYNADLLILEENTGNERKDEIYQNTKGLCTKDEIIEKLCKYDDYCDLSKEEKTRIINILKIYDEKNEIDKKILKRIIEEDYVESETKIWSKMDEKGGKKVRITIAPKAKKELLKHKGFPNSVNFFKDFEQASVRFAASEKDSGVKYLGKDNDALKDCYEIKLKNRNERFVSYRNNFYFDVYKQDHDSEYKYD